MSDGPVFLNVELVLETHDYVLGFDGGMVGVGDLGLIESAVASAQNAWLYGRGDNFDIAAAYAFHLAESQAFNDGNKRTAITCALTFLDLNGCYRRRPDPQEFEAAMIAIAKKELDKRGLAQLMRERCS
ncbi:MAG: type II toxin-antitoxin system death-on-curing family toxin [Pedosphaera sp. Tous-C6FEB]|nr:MAG: type II toxin-antitoxin system death-on-curing family toxin [Pedosphaera sp. Tous-C6FEB]